ncbi:MAG: peptidoglycan-binding domain-containing protein [Candidatus Omnitrophota bacterium]
MSKRPNKKHAPESEQLVMPEIEIITKPEADRYLLSGKRQKKESGIDISPKEVLPAVGQDASIRVRNYRVTDIQQALANAGFDPGPVDGKIGPKTKKAILSFQKQNNLTVDGVVGKKTWAILETYLKPPSDKKEVNE